MNEQGMPQAFPTLVGLFVLAYVLVLLILWVTRRKPWLFVVISVLWLIVTILAFGFYTRASAVEPTPTSPITATETTTTTLSVATETITTTFQVDTYPETPQETAALLYQVWSTGGTIAYLEYPTWATNFRCTLALYNFERDEYTWVETSQEIWPNPWNKFFHFDFDFRGYQWSVLGGEGYPTSACEAWNDEMGTSVVFDTTTYLDYRYKEFLPFLMR